MISSLVAEVQSSQGLHYKHPRDCINIKFPDNLECGNKIYIHGAVALAPTRFTVNLKDAEKDANTYLHFNPRFEDPGFVVRNSRFNEAWGEEEREGGNPFFPGEEFVLAIAATVDGYEIEVNGAPFTVFKHRDEMPLCNVTHISMAGDVVFYGVHIPLSYMPLPLTLRIPGNTHVGDMILLKAEVPDGSDRFAVNLQCTGDDDAADIMFHLNPRFGDGLVVCNSRCAEAWDSELREGLPIGPGDLFNMCIAASNDGFHTYINESPIIKMDHRMKMTTACALHINGDIRILDVCIDCPPPKMPPQMNDDSVHEADENSIEMVFSEYVANHTLRNALQPGNVLVLSGVLEEPATRFALNLQCGEDAESDIALHVNPRWDSEDGPVVVCNSYEGGVWGEEIRGINDVAPGNKLEVLVACKEDSFCIALDGNVTVESFPHRLDFRSITHVKVEGCLRMERLIVV